MKSFTAALIATAVSARGFSGGINQGYQNASFSATHGYGYNDSNDYIGGDGHGHALAFNAYGAADHYDDPYAFQNYFEP